MKRFTSRKLKDGFYHFYVGRKNITNLWYEFFSGLSIAEESRCLELFIKKYKKLFI